MFVRQWSEEVEGGGGHYFPICPAHCEFPTHPSPHVEFASPSFSSCLFVAHVPTRSGLRQVKKLCRPEWAAVRRLMGRPRRLSPHFLLQEREKLYRYREDIRLVQQGRVRYLHPLLTV
jgi:hypothetical protein